MTLGKTINVKQSIHQFDIDSGMAIYTVLILCKSLPVELTQLLFIYMSYLCTVSVYITDQSSVWLLSDI